MTNILEQLPNLDTLIWCSLKVTQGKLSLQQKNAISTRLHKMASEMPREFNRKLT